MQNAPRRVSQPNLRPPTTLLLQELSYTCQRSTRSRCTRESVQDPSSLLPDLRTRGFVVRPGIGDVVELVRPHRVRELLCKGLRLVVVVLRVFVRDRWDRIDFRSQHFEEIDLLLALNKKQHVRATQKGISYKNSST